MKSRQLKAGIILSYMSSLIQFAVLFIYTPFLLKCVGKSEYGVYTLAQSVVGYLSLLGMGLSSSYVRFYMRYKVQGDEQGIAKLNGMFLLVFTIISALTIVIGGIMVVFADSMFGAKLTPDEIHKMRAIMTLMVINTGNVFMSTVFVCNINANERYVFQKTVYTVIEHILCTVACAGVLALGGKTIAVTAVRTVAWFSYTFICIRYCVKNLKMRFSFKGIEFKLFKEIALFSGIIFINVIIDQVNWSVDKIILGAMSGSAAVAVYGVAAQLNSAYISCSTTISSVFAPSINKMAAEKNDAGLNALFTRIGRLQFMLLILVCSGFIFFGQSFINMWAGEEYSQAYIIELILMCCITIPLCQNLGIEIQRSKNKHKFRSYVYLGIAVFNIIVSILLCPKYGAVGCAIGTAIAMILGQIIIMNIHYHKKLNIDIIAFWKSIAKIIPALLIPVAAGVLMKMRMPSDTVITLAINITVYTVIYCVSLWFLGMNKDEKRIFTDILKHIKPKHA